MTMQAAVVSPETLSIRGWMSPGELLWLAEMASCHDYIVEFGSFCGRSTRALADNCSGRVWAVDPWSGFYPNVVNQQMEGINTYVYPEFCRNLADHIKSGRVVPHRGFSHSFKLPYKVDMVFIDGDHRYETVLKDIDKAIELLVSGGLICGHDYNWDSVKEAVTIKLGRVNEQETIWWTTKS